MVLISDFVAVLEELSNWITEKEQEDANKGVHSQVGLSEKCLKEARGKQGSPELRFDDGQ